MTQKTWCTAYKHHLKSAAQSKQTQIHNYGKIIPLFSPEDHDELRDYLNEKGFTERVRLDHSVIEAELIRLRDAKKRIYQDRLGIKY